MADEPASRSAIDQSMVVLYDAYTHGGLDRRTFLDRLAGLAGGAAAASAALALLENNYAKAQIVPEGDPRLRIEAFSTQGPQGDLRGVLARPVGSERLPGVVVVHENRGLNPHIADIGRRLALEGFVTFAVDFLSPLGGTPADEDKAREMIGTLKAPEVAANARAAIAALRARPDVNGKVGIVGFCWGGGVVGNVAVAEPALDAGVVFYGSQPRAEAVAALRAPLLLHYAGLDERINAGIPAFEAALKAGGKAYELHMYPGVNHAFNNDANPARYDKAAAQLAWARTVAFFKRTLAA